MIIVPHLLQIGMYAILSDIPPDNRYLFIAKALAADDWLNVLTHITEMFDQYSGGLFHLHATV